MKNISKNKTKYDIELKFAELMGHGEYIITDCQEGETDYIIWIKMYAMFNMFDISRFAKDGYIIEFIEARKDEEDGKPYIYARFRATP